jgi:hypothetical protein
MKKWCGIKKSMKSGRYRVIVPNLSDFIDDNMMINNDKVTGSILTRWLDDIEEAKTACMEFNALYEKYSK